jgi:hypothetical protein
MSCPALEDYIKAMMIIAAKIATPLLGKYNFSSLQYYFLAYIISAETKYYNRQTMQNIVLSWDENYNSRKVVVLFTVTVLEYNLYDSS